MERRVDQKMTEIDSTLEEYRSCGFMFNDYRQQEEDLSVVCDYDFLKHLNVGDIVQLRLEDSGNFIPFVISLELTDDENDLSYKLLRVTRKIYSAGSLDVYVVEYEDSDDL